MALIIFFFFKLQLVNSCIPLHKKNRQKYFSILKLNYRGKLIGSYALCSAMHVQQITRTVPKWELVAIECIS